MPEFSRHMLTEMRAEAATVLHVGDNFAADYEGAQGVGLYPVWLQRDPSSAPVAGARMVRSLTEIRAYLATPHALA